jgi:hypothetical protein
MTLWASVIAPGYEVIVEILISYTYVQCKVYVLESFDNAKFLPVERIYVRWFCILLLLLLRLRQGPELLQCATTENS